MIRASYPARCAPLLIAVLVIVAFSVPGAAQDASSTNSVSADLTRSRQMIEEGKTDAAIANLTQLAQSQPNAPGLEALLGKAYYERRDYVQAIAHLEPAVKQDPNDGESTQLLGLSYYLAGHLQQAIPLLEKVQSRLSRPDVTGSYVLGISYLQSREYDKARLAFAKMFSVPPESAASHLLLAQMMIRQEFEDKAVPELQKAIELDAKLPMAHFLLGEVYLFKSHVKPALEEFNRELTLNPLLWLVYWRMGDGYTRLENWNEAERCLKQAIWLNQNFTGPYILLGKVELKKGDAQLATGFLEKAVKMDANNNLAHYLLGSAYKRMGRDADAEREFKLTQTLREDKQP